MRHYTIATAGHVDHGKSTLVRALTGINPDRLIEEQRREMTIDLGFAYMHLPKLAGSGQTTKDRDLLGIIDVPGHIDFIENMLAGVGGIDAAILVIAADEGPMPQTREHLAILDLLNVQRGIVALTKTDLAPDADWVPLISDDIRKLLANTPLRDAPIVPVSARKQAGLKELLLALQQLLLEVPAPDERGAPRLAVDRTFSVQGYGTVVTGTLLGGPLNVGDELEVLPQGHVTRVRGLQTHKAKLDHAQPGSRCAVNLTGLSLEQIKRGSVLARPGALKATRLLDARVELRDYGLSVAGQRAVPLLLKHNQEVKLFVGAAETVAIAKLLEGNELRPGQSGWVQFVLAEPIACARGDRFIVRMPSPSITLGGGAIADPAPPQLHRRRAGSVSADVTERLSAGLRGTPAERLTSALRPARLLLEPEAIAAAALEPAEFADALAGAVDVQNIDGVLALRETWQGLQAQASQLLAGFHKTQPLLEGMPKDTVRSRLGLAVKPFAALLKSSLDFVSEGDSVRLTTHRVGFTPQQQQQVDKLLRTMRNAPWNTPLIKDCKLEIGDGVFDVLLRQRKLVAVNEDVVFLPETYEDALAKVRAHISTNGQITAAEVRDMFQTSRKYALALLEHLDVIGVTKRVGDARVLKG